MVPFRPRSFLDLARLVDPGSEPKTDKNTILTDTIKYVQQTTIENHQLRQLNKFLEVRRQASRDIRRLWMFPWSKAARLI